jgi:Calcineurin-like phosphoesterase
MTTRRRFRFFLWNDMHVRAPEIIAQHPTYPFANEKAAWAAECAQGKHGIERPDLVVSAGDIINGEIPDFGLDFRYLQAAVVSQVGVPFLPCVGNHENQQGEGLPESSRAYDAAFRGGRRNYVFTFGGIAFVVVDTSGAHRLPDPVTAARNAFVERALGQVSDTPTMVVTHVPLIAMRDEGPLRASFGFSSWRVLDTRMLEIVEQHADHVIAVLCGHIHLTGVREQRGIYHIMPAGTCGYPSDFAALDVYGDRIQVTMERAPEQWLDRRGDIHGKPRHPIDYADAEHPDHDCYVWGTRQEREFAIPLVGRRRPAPRGAPALSFLPPA